jgi:hypothetical protein
MLPSASRNGTSAWRSRRASTGANGSANSCSNATPAAAPPGQQRLGAAVERAEAAFAVEREQTRAQRADELDPRVDRQHDVGVALAREQQVLDLRRRHLQQRLGVPLARDSKYDDASSTPTRLPPASRIGEAVHERSPKRVKKCSGPWTDSVRPLASAVPMPLVPATCSLQWLPTTMSSPEWLVAKRLSAYSRGSRRRLGQREQEIRAGDLVEQRLELRQREAAHQLGLLAADA